MGKASKAKQFIADGFQNILKGLGTGRAASPNGTYVRNPRITRQLANDMYTSNWLAAKVIDAPIDDIMRAWREFLIDDSTKRKEVEEVMKYYQVKEKVSMAARWARLFGGSAIIIMIDGEDPEQPLDMSRIRPGTLSNLIVLDRYNMFPGPIDRNILSPTFGLPEYYMVIRNGQPVHRSRVILFQGHISTIFEWEQHYYWGQPILARLYEPIMDSLSVGQNISQLVYEASVDVYKVDGLNEMVAGGEDKKVIDRLRISDEMKGTVHSLVLDGADTYERKTITFSHLADIDDRKIQKVSGASGIPVTRLVGISPAGMNSTGDNDMRNYYDLVEQAAENSLRPVLARLDAIVNASAFGGMDELEFEFNPLQRLTPKEKAEVDLKRATRDKTYLESGTVSQYDVVSQLQADGTYVAIDVNRVEAEKNDPERNTPEKKEEPEPNRTEKEKVKDRSEEGAD